MPPQDDTRAYEPVACPKCGHYNPAHTKFCSGCGYSFVERAPRRVAPPSDAARPWYMGMLEGGGSLWGVFNALLALFMGLGGLNILSSGGQYAGLVDTTMYNYEANPMLGGLLIVGAVIVGLGYLYVGYLFKRGVERSFIKFIMFVGLVCLALGIYYSQAVSYLQEYHGTTKIVDSGWAGVAPYVSLLAILWGAYLLIAAAIVSHRRE